MAPQLGHDHWLFSASAFVSSSQVKLWLSSAITPRPRQSGLRVLFLASDAHGGFGGISTYNRDVIDAMCQMPSINEIVVLPRIRPTDGFVAPAKATYELASARGARAYLTRSLIQGLGSRIDLVYCAHINLLPIAALIARSRRVPLVLAIYGIDAWTKPSGRLTSAGLSAVSLVVSISQTTLDRFRAWSGFPEEKCAILPNAFHGGDFAMGPKDNALSRRLGVSDRPTITTFGRMVSYERYKGFDEVIEAMPRLLKRIPRLVYVAAGDGTDKSRLMAKVAGLGLEASVVFTGRIDEAEKADLYRLSDAYVMPSSGEGFGFVVLEALACGIPVVASTIDGTREAVRNGELGLLVDPKDGEGLAKAVLVALSRPKAIPPGLDYFSFANFEKRLSTALGKVAAVA